MAGVADGTPEGAEFSSPAPGALDLTPREVTTVERPSKKICHFMGSTSSASSEEDVWAYLPDNLLHLIIFLLSSFHDFLAVTSTCRSWHSAASSFPSMHNLTFPPLYAKTGGRYAHRYMGGQSDSHSPLSNYKWKLRDPAKKQLSLCCSAPRNSPYYVRYLGCSYGYFILSCWEQCFLLDVYTKAMVKLPKFRRSDSSEIYYGIFITTPLNSANSYLLLCARKSMLWWQVGAKSWIEHTLVADSIHQIVSYKGQLFAVDSFQKLSIISLAPDQLSMREVPVVWGKDIISGLHKNPWLVVCGDMLLMVDLSKSVHQSDNFLDSFCFLIFCLDLSAKPAIWVKVEKLENWAIFLSIDRRSPTFSCMNPKRWGGKSNCIYVPSTSENSDEPWIAVEVGQSIPSRTHHVPYILEGKGRHLENLWVLPSLFYGVSV